MTINLSNKKKYNLETRTISKNVKAFDKIIIYLDKNKRMLYSIDFEENTGSSRTLETALIYSSPTDIADFFILKKINKIAFFTNNKIILINKDGTKNVEFNFETGYGQLINDINELSIEGDNKIVIITLYDVYVYNYNKAEPTQMNLYYNELDNFMYSKKIQVSGEFVFVSFSAGGIKKFSITDFYENRERPLIHYDNSNHDFKLLSTNEIVGTYFDYSNRKKYLVSWLDKNKYGESEPYSIRKNENPVEIGRETSFSIDKNDNIYIFRNDNIYIYDKEINLIKTINYLGREEPINSMIINNKLLYLDKTKTGSTLTVVNLIDEEEEKNLIDELASISIGITAMKLRQRFYISGNFENEKKKIKGLIYCLSKFFKLKRLMSSSDTIKKISFISEGSFGQGYEIILSNSKQFFMKINTTRAGSFKSNQDEYNKMTQFSHPNIIKSIGAIDFSSTSSYSTTDTPINKSVFLVKKNGNADILMDYSDKLVLNQYFDHKTFVIISDLYEGTINQIPKSIWLNPLNLLKFIMSVLDGLYNIYKNGYSHKDIKPENIAYIREPSGEYYYKIIDLGGIIKLTDSFSNTDLRYYNADTRPRQIDVYTTGYTPKEYLSRDRLITSKYDTYSIGVTIIELLTPLNASNRELRWLTSRTGESNLFDFFESIRFLKSDGDKYNLKNISYLLKDFLKLLVSDKFFERTSIYFAVKKLVDIVYQLDYNSQNKIKDYLIANYTHNSFKEGKTIKTNLTLSPDNYSFINLYNRLYSLILHNFKNSSIKYACELSIKNLQIKHRVSQVNTIKYSLCNFLDYKDKLVKGDFYDGGHNLASRMIIRKKEFTLENLIAENRGGLREILHVDKVELNKFLNKIVTKIKANTGLTYSTRLSLEDELKFLKNLADHVHKMYNNNSLNYISDLISKTNESINRLRKINQVVKLSDVIKNNYGVCRHRAITFKYFCDKLGIMCRLIRGLLHSDSQGIFLYDSKNVTAGGYHAWNTVKLKNGKTLLVDIMNPEYINGGLANNYDNKRLRHLYAIPALEIDRSIQRGIKKKMVGYDIF